MNIYDILAEAYGWSYRGYLVSFSRNCIRLWKETVPGTFEKVTEQPVYEGYIEEAQLVSYRIIDGLLA